MNKLALSTAIPYEMETLLEQEKPNTFMMLMSSARTGRDAVFDKASFKYQRGPSLRSNKKKKRKADDVLAMRAQAISSKKLSTTFLQHRAVQPPTLLLSRQDLLKPKRVEAIEGLEKKLELKKEYITTNPTAISRLTNIRKIVNFSNAYSSPPPIFIDVSRYFLNLKHVKYWKIT
jgi:hypothetical protein